jgi:hypothetical protein
MFNPDALIAWVYMPSLETAARSLKVVPIIAPVRLKWPGFGRDPGRGLIVIPDGIHVRASRTDHIGGGRNLGRVGMSRRYAIVGVAAVSVVPSRAFAESSRAGP